MYQWMIIYSPFLNTDVIFFIEFPALYFFVICSECGKNGQTDHHFPVSFDQCKLMINKLSICSYNFNSEVITIKKHLLNALKLSGHHKLELDGRWYWNLQLFHEYSLFPLYSCKSI